MSQPTTQTATWFPQLDGLGLPRALTNGMGQAYSLIYSYRNQTDTTLTILARFVEYGLHRDRLNMATAGVPNGALWFETDRATVFYQARLLPEGPPAQWVYAGGIMWDVLAHRPDDLKKADTGFLFQDSGSFQMYRWDGTAWAAI